MTIDGKVYASAGKIGGWIINDSNLSSAGTAQEIELTGTETNNKYV